MEAPGEPYRLIGCYHPSQQNTFTGKLTEPMIDEVFERARALAHGPLEPVVRAADEQRPGERYSLSMVLAVAVAATKEVG